MRRRRIVPALVLAAGLTLTLPGCAPFPFEYVIGDYFGSEEYENVDPATDPVALREHASAVRRTEELAMEEDRFWELIATLNGSVTERSLRMLKREMNSLTLEELQAFDARLTLAVHELDTAKTANWYRHHEPISVELQYFSYDAFLYDRAATVGAGRDAFEKAAAADQLVLDPAGEGIGELLLYVVIDIAEIRGIDWFDLEPAPLSYETASNIPEWPADEWPE
jgi:Protein of unknown function (DUF4240)